MNEVVTEDRTEGYYILKGANGARAIELVYDGHRAVINDGSRARSIERAKHVLRAYKLRTYFSKGKQPPVGQWATLCPVHAATREQELRALRALGYRRALLHRTHSSGPMR